MYRKSLFLVGAAQLIIYTLAYQGPLSHIIYYHEQHHLFRFSRAYFQQQCHSHGLLSYLTDFVIQFFYHPLLGSLVIAAILVAVWALVRFAIKHITGHSDLLNISVIPSLAFFLYTMEADHNLTLIVGTLLSLIALCLLLALLPKKHYSLFLIHSSLFTLPYSLFQRRWIRIALMVVPLLAYTAFGYAYFLTHYNHPERIMLMAEQRIKAHDAHGVLQYTSRYMDSGRQNQLIHYFHNLALLQTGQLPYHLLDYPPYMGVKCLYFAWESNSRESEYGHFIYEQLGYINEAQRWESEAMVVWGEQSSHLLNLVRYNIVNGRPRVAQRFINLLKETLYYRSQAETLESLRDSAHIPGLHNALPPVSLTTSPNSQLSIINYQSSTPPSFANVFNIGPELEYICQRDTANQAAFEYLMSYLLLSNDVMRFVRDLPMIHRFDYPQLPTMWQEALCIYRMRVTDDEFDALGFTISPEVTSRFNRYMKLASNRDLATLQREFGHTYWYYLNYVSPYGSRVLNLN